MMGRFSMQPEYKTASSAKNSIKVLGVMVLFGLLSACGNNASNSTSNLSVSLSNISFQKPSEKGHGYIITDQQICCFEDVDRIHRPLRTVLLPADSNVVEQIEEIMNYSGLALNFLVYQGNVATVAATSIGNERIIIYNPKLYHGFHKQSNNYWSLLFMLSHEIGHLLLNNLSENHTSIEADLKADAFASGILFNMGADSISTAAALQSNLISHLEYPSKEERIMNTLQQWKKAKDIYVKDVDPWVPEATSEAEPFNLNQVLVRTPSRECKGSTFRKSCNLEGKIISIRRMTGFLAENDDIGISFEIECLLTNIPHNSPNELNYKPNTKGKFTLYMNQVEKDPQQGYQRLGDEEEFRLMKHLPMGQPIRLTVYGYLDQDFYQIVEIEKR